MPKPLFCANGDAIWLRIHAHTVLQAAEKQCGWTSAQGHQPP